MRTNRTRTIIAAGNVALGTLGTTASPLMVEALGHAGFDFIVIDLQHGENNLGNVQAMLQAVSATPATPLVRLPANAPIYIQRTLDLGAYGVVVPMVESRSEAEAIVRSVRYAPHGQRSWGPVRGTLYGGPDYFESAAGELMTIVMLESEAGLGNAPAILATPGIDGCFIGPNDLSIALGFGPEQADLPAPVEAAIARILAASLASGKFAGIQCFSPEAAVARIAQGFRFVSILSDLRMARSYAGAVVKSLRA